MNCPNCKRTLLPARTREDRQAIDGMKCDHCGKIFVLNDTHHLVPFDSRPSPASKISQKEVGDRPQVVHVEHIGDSLKDTLPSLREVVQVGNKLVNKDTGNVVGGVIDVNIPTIETLKIAEELQANSLIDRGDGILVHGELTKAKRKKTYKLSREQKEDVKHRILVYEPVWDIASRYGVTDETIYRLRRKLGIHGRLPKSKARKRQVLQQKAKPLAKVEELPKESVDYSMRFNTLVIRKVRNGFMMEAHEKQGTYSDYDTYVFADIKAMVDWMQG